MCLADAFIQSDQQRIQAIGYFQYVYSLESTTFVMFYKLSYRNILQLLHMSLLDFSGLELSPLLLLLLQR